VFLDHLGIATLNVGFAGESGGGAYHSIYDSIDHYTRFGDPGYAYGVALVQAAGRIVLRLANAETLPFDFTATSEAISGYVREIAKLADDLREETEKRNRLIREGRYDAAADPLVPTVPPKVLPPVPHLNLAPLQNAVEHLKRSARDYDQARRDREKSGKPLGPDAAKSLDVLLMKTERALTRDEGLPRRPWFKHAVYAPGFYTGYGVKTLPGLREAVEERKWEEAATQGEAAAAAIERFSAEIDRAAPLLRAGLQD
jgi:N-acetylated-alpha-linked acidic dipeptidase